MKKYYIETYGCQMNFAQSAQLKEKMKAGGFLFSPDYQDSDIIIINACSVRQHAEDKVFNRIQFFNSLKKKNNIKLLVTGCFAQNNRDKIDSDIVMGSSRISDIPDILMQPFKTRYVDVELEKYEFLKPVIEAKYAFRSYIDITKGCNNYCSYCIVPYVRGEQVSRSSDQIMREIESLGEQGVTEIILLGQNVNTYGKDNKDISFAELLTRINRIENIKRIRFLTSHPKDFTDDIIQSIFDNNKVAPGIHLPLQSGSDKILKLMNRKYDLARYMDIIQKIKSRKKDYSLSTDFLVGFPGETDEDYKKTIEAVKKIRFNEAYMFKYSSRPYIAANKFKDEVPELERRHRLQNLINLQKSIENDVIKDNLNKERTVLIEGRSKKNKDQWIGRDELNYQVIVDNKVVPGNYYKVIIHKTVGSVLFADISELRRKEQCA